MSAAPAPPPTSGSAQRWLVQAFTEHLGLKATAVFLAIVLWFVVNLKEQPQIELVPVRFMPVLDSSLVLREPPPPLQALVAGSAKELIKLNSTSLTIRRTIAADAPDTVVLDLRPSDVTLPDGVDAIVRDVAPRSVTLRFETTWTRRVVVHSAINIATVQYSGPITPVFDPETVQVSGPRHLVLRVPSVRTVRTTLTYPDSLPHLIDIDTTGFGPLQVKPQSVKVMLKPLPNP